MTKRKYIFFLAIIAVVLILMFWVAFRPQLNKEISISALLISPDFKIDGTIFASGYENKVSSITFGSIDGGQTWAKLKNNGPPATMIGIMEISPNFTNDQTLFGVHMPSMGNIDQKRLGIYKSTDAGKSWKKIAPIDTGRILLSPDYVSDQTILARESRGPWEIFESTNGGKKWHQITARFPDKRITDIVFSPNYAQDKTMFFGTRLGKKWLGDLYKSTDGGLHWTKIEGAGNLIVNRISLSPDYKVDQTIFVSRFDGLYRSTNGGEKWRKIIEIREKERVRKLLQIGSITLSPAYPSDRTVFITQANRFKSGRSMYRSTNGGKSWTRIDAERFNVLAISPDYKEDKTVFSGGRSGVFRSTDGGQTWDYWR